MVSEELYCKGTEHGFASELCYVQANDCVGYLFPQLQNGILASGLPYRGLAHHRIL